MENMQPGPAPRKSSGCALALGIGCGSVAVLAIIVVLLVYFNLRKIETGVARFIIKQMMTEATLTQEEEDRLNKSLERVFVKFEKGELNEEQIIQPLRKAMEKGSLAHAVVTLSLKMQLRSSKLAEAEKQSGSRDLDRLLRGVHEGKISRDEMSKLSEKLPSPKQGEKVPFTFNTGITDDQLRQILGEAKTLAESKSIPDEDFKYDFAGEVDKVVNAVLSEEGK